jgi:hypothetical protein
MEEVTMAFLESEVEHWDTDEATGQMRLHVALETVLCKFPRNHKVKICLWDSKAAVEAEYFPRLSGVRFENWVAMNFEQTTNGVRMLTTYASLLENLSCLAETYGKGPLNDALGRCDVPRKCTVGYVKAILRNSVSAKNPPQAKKESGYLAQIEKVASRLK